MRRLFYVLAATSAFITSGLSLLDGIFQPFVLMISPQDRHLYLLRDLLEALIAITLAFVSAFAGRHAEQNKMAAITCLFVAVAVVCLGLYEGHDLIHNPQPAFMRGEEGWAFFFLAIPATILGGIGVVGSLGLLFIPWSASAEFSIPQSQKD